MTKVRGKPFAFAALAALSLGLAACGGSSETSSSDKALPANAVAIVGDESITRGEFDRALVTATKQEQQTSPLTAALVPPDPPSYAKCIAALRKNGANFADFILKKMCREDFVHLRDQAMSQLLQTTQLEKLAEDRDIVVTSKEVNAVFASQIRQTRLLARLNQSDIRKLLMKQGASWKEANAVLASGEIQQFRLSPSDLRKRLAWVRATRKDFLPSIRIQLLSTKIAEDFGADQAALQAAQERMKKETTCRQGFAVPGACGN